jgi:ABC-type uncharacterized transport system permease subunit
MSFLSKIEAPFLLISVALYLGAMLLFWVGLFFWPKEPEGSPKHKSSPGHIAKICLWIAVTTHLLAIAGQGPSLFTLKAGVAGLFGWLLVVSFLMVGSKMGTGSGSIVAPVALCSAIYSLAAPQLHTFSPKGWLEGVWLAAHVFIILLGYVALAFAFVSSLLYLVQEGLLKRRKLTGLWQKLPPLGVADEWIYRATAFGISLLTVGLVLGVAYSAAIEPFYNPFRDPKVLFSFATWAVFIMYLSSRWWLGWHGRRSSMVVIGGFVLMAVSFFGVPHLVTVTP